MANVGLNRYRREVVLADGAEPQKPELAIPLNELLINRNEVVGFRGEKMSGICPTCKKNSLMFANTAEIMGIQPYCINPECPDSKFRLDGRD